MDDRPPLRHDSAPNPDVLHLPTVHELPKDDRKKVELVRLHGLLERLARRPECAGSGLHAALADAPGATDADLEKLNMNILVALATTKPEIELAYSLGRSLRDTVNPRRMITMNDSGEPSAPQAVLSDMLDRGRNDNKPAVSAPRGHDPARPHVSRAVTTRRPCAVRCWRTQPMGVRTAADIRTFTTSAIVDGYAVPPDHSDGDAAGVMRC
jgi:hypothetical protein